MLCPYFAYTLCKNHVPHHAKETFEVRFKVAPPSQLAPNNNEYLLNETNMPTAIALQSHLRVRDDRLKQTNTQILNLGLGGLVIEGEPGEGKSQLILSQLVGNGYQEHRDFIYIPAKSKPNEIKQKLLEGFHQGLIVVIDEMNSLPLPEQLLNALLEGQDLEGKAADKPGFLLLGTQNPTTYQGRLKTTAPLEHRLQKVILPKSSLLEKIAVLTWMGLPPRIAEDMVNEHTKHPQLTFRDMIKTAKRWLETNQNRPPLQLDINPIKQVGSLCKIVTIANAEKYYAEQMQYTAIPLWSEQKGVESIRKKAKAHQSTQGEILEFDQWQKTLQSLGFESEIIDYQQDMKQFVASIIDNLKQQNLPLIAFPVDRESGLPDPETDEPEETEHAALISGYNWQTDEFTLVHWGKTYQVDAVQLFNASHKLVNTRQQEFYTRA